jgi:iron complex outermembrane receptor protein
MFLIPFLFLGIGKGEERIEVGEVTVTATRTEKEVGKAPASVEIVTGSEAEMRGSRTVDEAMNSLSGVFNRRAKGLMDTLASISLRGIPGQARTLVLVDGMPLNRPYTGDVNFGGFLSPMDIGRIEVVKGPFSSLYGGYAMGGVVNVVTRMPKGRELTLKGNYGSDLLYNGYISYGDRLMEKLGLLVSLGYRSTRGYVSDLVVQSAKPEGLSGWSQTTDRTGKECYVIGDKGFNGAMDGSVLAKVGYDISKSLKVGGYFLRGWYRYFYEEPHTYLLDPQGNPVWSYGKVKESSFLSGGGGETQDILNLTSEVELPLLSSKLLLGLNSSGKWYITPGDKATRDGGPGTLTETESRGYYAEVQSTTSILKGHTVSFGGSIWYGMADTKENGLENWKERGSKTELSYESKGKEIRSALFLQEEARILENLGVYLGLRADFWRTFGGYANQVGAPEYPKEYPSKASAFLSPKLALVFIPFDGTSLKASVGKAFRPPTIYELYRTWTSVRTGITYQGNPELGPESTTSWDVGLEQRIWKRLLVKLSVFDNEMEDLIYRRSISKTLQDYINVGKARSRGVELGIEGRFGWAKPFMNYTYVDAKILENEAKPETVGKQLTAVPKATFNCGVDLSHGPISASLVGRYVSKRFDTDDNTDTVTGVHGSRDPYFLLDMKVSYRLMKSLSLSLSATNLLDSEYFDYYKAPGRKIVGEVSGRI